jgi:thioredoxin
MDHSMTLDDRGILTRCPRCGTTNRLAYPTLGHTVRCGRCRTTLPPPASPIDITTPELFDALIASSVLPVVVDFWAPWCGPCRMVAPVLEEIAQEKGDAIQIVKLNVDENPETAAKFQVMSIPTLILFRDGDVAHKVIGALPKRRLEAELEPALA